MNRRCRRNPKGWIFAGAAAALIVNAAALSSSRPAEARNTQYYLKIEDVKSDSRYSSAVPADVAFYFADQPHPPLTTSFGDAVTNRKGNSFGRPDEDACRWTMMSALKTLHDRAVEEGGNAVIGIVSYYQKNTYSSATQYECHAGGFVAGVALKGTVVKLAK
jgi:uncharacterized protein YbjQ (UPF0145 family)